MLTAEVHWIILHFLLALLKGWGKKEYSCHLMKLRLVFYVSSVLAVLRQTARTL